LGFANGCVPSQATNATRYSGRNRFSATRMPVALRARYAVNHALNIVASPALYVNACWKYRFAFVCVADAFASFNDDSVPHFAAEYPDHPATSVTIESNTASAIEINRSWRVWPTCSPACFACSPISLPTSAADNPSGITRSSPNVFARRLATDPDLDSPSRPRAPQTGRGTPAHSVTSRALVSGSS
jgi:hypothetical protein